MDLMSKSDPIVVVMAKDPVTGRFGQVGFTERIAYVFRLGFFE
jgi:hypothetical protein